jgi:heme/copper-type cytochrome/quinol oxidase subunit 3
MGVAAIFGIFAGVFYWFPLMFGRMLNETLGKIHFFATFVGVYALFLPMHLAGVAGNPRRYADFTNFEFLTPLIPLHQFMTWAAFFTAAAQLLFFANLILSIQRGPVAATNPWRAETLEWMGGDSRSPVGRSRGVSAGFLAVVAAVSMLFAAFSSAYVVRHGISGDWSALPLPPTVWASTGFLLLGSILLVKRVTFSNIAAGLGMMFALTLLWSWHRLIQSGVSMSSGPAAAFFYVMIGAFLVLVIGGVVALLRGAVFFWHYLTALWIYLVCLFYLWN